MISIDEESGTTELQKKTTIQRKNKSKTAYTHIDGSASAIDAIHAPSRLLMA